jgi:plastocyanin
MNKNLAMWIGIAVLLLIVAGGGVWFMSRKNTAGPATTTTPSAIPTSVSMPTAEVTTTPAVSTGKVVELAVTGSGFKFNPATLKVKQGDTVRLTFKSVAAAHDFVIDQFDVKTNTLGDGEEEEIEFVADKAGTFEYYCSVGNHRAMGMVGTLVVE